MLIECLTDNKNRAASEVRLAITRNGGSVATPGSVSYMFNRKGVVSLPKKDLTEDDLLMVVLDAGADEVKEAGDNFEIISEAADLRAVVAALEEAGIEYDTDEAEFLPSMHRGARRRQRTEVHEARSTRWKTWTTSRTSTPTLTSPRTSSRSSKKTEHRVPLRVLGVDPGLTRCGLGVVDVEGNRRATMVAVGVAGT